MMEFMTIRRGDPRYPASLEKHLGAHAPRALTVLGNPEILRRPTLAIFCSVRCPGNLILKTYDAARALRRADVAVISGFHSPMERECLDLLLRGTQPVIACAARRLASGRIPAKYALPIREGRLLMISPFGEKVRRATVETAGIRNEVVAALAHRVFVAHASRGSRTEALCRKVVEWGKPLVTFECEENRFLIDLGAVPRGISEIVVRKNG